ncbi:hypothetical protein [Variovorax fucosicus]|uniref:hypothetical protein n=1 Tax=Variovorax fucosicus TaxID=3053517 RepID=UPI0025782364|nr:hypothetical protein [Variovorax sp. J22G47]MDM0055385.1 hypothetical protein [Variovorax sp. J22G47]
MSKSKCWTGGSKYSMGDWRRYPTLLLFPLAAGCQMRGEVRPLSSEIPPPPAFVAAPEACLAARSRFALGQRISLPLLEELRQRTGARRARAQRIDDPQKNAESDAARLTVDVEPSGRIVGARCA